MASLLLFAATARADSLHTQEFTLNPGWNSIWLHVQPTNTSPSAIFNSLPLESLWTFSSRLSSVDFIQDPNEPVWNKSKWLLHVPTNRVESFQNSLFRVTGNRPYLVRLNGNAPVTLRVTGTPLLAPAEWAPDAYTLRGFPVDPANPPTFGQFFRGSPAHYDSALNQLRKIYRLSAAGAWIQVDADDRTMPGEACWVYTQGASQYQAPLNVQSSFGDTLEFSVTGNLGSIHFANKTGSQVGAALRDLGGAVSLLSFASFDPNTGTTWTPLAANMSVTLDARANRELRLTPRRNEMTAPLYETIFEIKDGAGTRHLLAVRAEKSDAPVASNPVVPGEQTKAGLWMGGVALNAVSQSGATNFTVPTPAASPVNLRLLIHVDKNGQARLLKEVIQMTKPPTYTNAPSGFKAISEPERAVLLTDETLIGNFAGSAVRDGAPIGRRVSSVGFDWFSTPTNNFLNLSGEFLLNKTLTGTINLSPEFTTNPFKHKYHPDHDNLDPTFRAFKQEAYSITRNISIQLTSTNVFNNAAEPNYGQDVLTGHYSETLTGLHRRPIIMSGPFRLSRVSLVDELNK